MSMILNSFDVQTSEPAFQCIVILDRAWAWIGVLGDIEQRCMLMGGPWDVLRGARHGCWMGNKSRNIFSGHQYWNFSGIRRYFGRWKMKLGIEAHLGLKIAIVPPAGGRRSRRVGSEKPLKNGHDKEHGDENGSGNKPKWNSIDWVIKVPPMIISLWIWWSSSWW